MPSRKRRNKKKSDPSTKAAASIALLAKSPQKAIKPTEAGTKPIPPNLAASKQGANAALTTGQENFIVNKPAAIIHQGEDELIKQDAPALMKLLESYQQKVAKVEAELKNGLQKVVEDTLDKKFDLNNGISLLEVKYQVMLSYCIRICFYLLLKLTGKPVSKHKLVEQQAHLRAFVEKLRPINKKIKYQVGQLLRASAMQDNAESNSKSDASNPLAFKPSPLNMVQEDKKASDIPTSVYRPPQVAPTEMVDKAKAKKAKQQRKLQKQASSVIQDLKEMVSEAPTEISHNSFSKDVNRVDAQREKFEEENFVRIPITKKERAQLKKNQQQRNVAMDAIADLDKFTSLIKSTESSKEDAGGEELAALRREKALRAAEGASTGKKRKFDDDEAATGTTTKKRNRGKKKKKHSLRGMKRR